jgi:NADH:ubiquinone oxidoreductase subunit 4 (subunit M)
MMSSVGVPGLNGFVGEVLVLVVAVEVLVFEVDDFVVFREVVFCEVFVAGEP